MEAKGLEALGLRLGDHIEVLCGDFPHEGTFRRIEVSGTETYLVLGSRWQPDSEEYFYLDDGLRLRRRWLNLPYPPAWTQPLRRWWESGCRLSWTLGHAGHHATVSLYWGWHRRDDGRISWWNVVQWRRNRYAHRIAWWGPVVVYKMTPIRDEQGRAFPWESEAPHA